MCRYCELYERGDLYGRMILLADFVWRQKEREAEEICMGGGPERPFYYGRLIVRGGSVWLRVRAGLYLFVVWEGACQSARQEQAPKNGRADLGARSVIW